MNKKILQKIFAIVAVLAISCTMLTACGDKKNDNDGVDSKDDSANVDTPNDEQEELQPMIPSLTIDGESIDISSNPVMLTVDGVDVPFDELRYNYLYYTSVYGLTDEFWEENSALFPVLLEQIAGQCIESSLSEIIANEYGITLDEEDMAEVDDFIQQQKDAYDSDEEYQADLEFEGFSEDLLRRLITKAILNDKVYYELYGGESPKLIGTDDEIKEDIKENYVRVYHVLIASDHFSGQEGYEDATDDELAQAAKELAEKTLAEIQTGEAKVYDLAQTIGDDPGMIDNENGYLFTYGTMVEPFEKASFALGVGETSGLVETDYGWHIITRLEQDSYVSDNFDTVKETYIDDKYNAHLYQVYNDAEIVYSDYYNKMTPDSIT